MGPCQLVRSSCHEVAEGATLVTIDGARLATYAVELARELARPDQDPPPAAGGNGQAPDLELTAGLVLALGTINFGSGYHDAVTKLPGLSGARTMATQLRREISARGSIDASWLMSLSEVDCARIFGQDLAQPDQAELMGLFAAALQQLGLLVATEHEGSFLGLVRAADGSAERLAGSLLAMPFYLDRCSLPAPSPDHGASTVATVHFYKRAQLTAADLARAFDHRPPADFSDLERLTCFADNLVPHVLRVDGVLRYHPELAATIDAGGRLAPGSRAEIEIRACGVVAVERLVAPVGAQCRRPTRAMDLDLALWCRGSGARYKAIPRHRSRCVFY